MMRYIVADRTEHYTTICHEHNPVFTSQSITKNQTNAQTN